MPAICFSPLRGKRVRVTRLDECCRYPDPGEPCSFAVSDGFISVNFSQEIEAGEEITVKNANGDLCVTDRSCDTFKRVNLEIEWCRVDPELFEIITGVTLETDYKGDAVGYRQAAVSICNNFGFELWSGIPGQDCDPDEPLPRFGYFLVPCVTGGLVTDFTIENGATTFTTTGYSKSGSGWGIGPWDVVEQDTAGTPGPLLTPIAAGEHFLLRSTLVPPPAASCGCQTMPGVLNQQCSVDINLPTPGQTPIDTATNVEFDATATDSEDGDITASLVWTSSIDGNIGAGGNFTTTLTEGTHIVTARAVDSGGRFCTATVTVIVDPIVVNTDPVINDIEPAGIGGNLGPINVDFEAAVDATDAEDGDVSATAVWVSDLDGEIATGSSPTIPAASMTVGTHTITVTVNDTEGAETSATFTLVVG